MPTPAILDPTAADYVPSPLYRLTLGQYEAMVASGAFAGRDRSHLIDGFLVAKMPRNDLRGTADALCGLALQRVIPARWHVRSSKPVRLPSQVSKPEPDRCVVRGIIRDYRERSPGAVDIALVVEVADASLGEDRKLGRIYGGSGIPTDWVVNRVDRQVEVDTLPDCDGYHARQDLAAGEFVPVVSDGTEVGRVAVADLSP